MYFKTKLCVKFRNGTCPYITNCNFAHGVDELRDPPPNVAEPREEHAIPTFSCSLDSRIESQQRSYRGRQCKKFYTEEGCPYGDSCTFLHDDQSRRRESVVISLSPSVVNGSGCGGAGSSSNVVCVKPSNWKTRVCNKWEMSGNCPFGSNCNYAHGLQELHNHGDGLPKLEARNSSTATSELKQSGNSLNVPNNMVMGSAVAITKDGYNMGTGPSQRPPISVQRPNQRQKWKGPNKISRIYGDWIDDID